MITKFKLYEEYDDFEDDDYEDAHMYDDLDSTFFGETDYGLDFSELKKYFPNYTESEDELFFNVYHHQDAQYNTYSVSISISGEILIYNHIDNIGKEFYKKDLREFNSEEIIGETLSVFKDSFPSAFENYKKEMGDKINISYIFKNMKRKEFNL